MLLREEIDKYSDVLLEQEHTARGKPRRANTIKAAILIGAFPPITCSIPSEYSPTDIKLITAVPAMQTNTIKLLIAHTNLDPNLRHIGSIKNELMPRTTCIITRM
jgi:hypothetical protein